MTEKYGVLALLNGQAARERNIPDKVLVSVWDQIVKEGKDKIVWYGGSVTNADEWLVFIKNPCRHPIFVVDQGQQKIVMLAWIDKYERGVARGHFCAVGPYLRGVGETALNWWRSMKNEENGKHTIKTIWGMTPECYAEALELIKLMGITRLGTMPNGCWLHYEQRHVGGVISYLNFEEEN